MTTEHTGDPTGDREVHVTIELLSQYLDQMLAPADRSAVEAHLAECGACRSELIEVHRVLRGTVNRRRTGRWAFGLAAAIAMLIVGWRMSADGPAPDRFRADPAETSIAAVAPAADAELPGAGLTFRWRSVGPDAQYHLTISYPNGTPVWRSITGDTALRPPDSIVSRLSGPYFWTVDAIRIDGTAISSDPRRVVILP